MFDEGLIINDGYRTDMSDRDRQDRGVANGADA
jgi:hypothetical protein